MTENNENSTVEVLLRRIEENGAEKAELQNQIQTLMGINMELNRELEKEKGIKKREIPTTIDERKWKEQAEALMIELTQKDVECNDLKAVVEKQKRTMESWKSMDMLQEGVKRKPPDDLASEPPKVTVLPDAKIKEAPIERDRFAKETEFLKKKKYKPELQTQKQMRYVKNGCTPIICHKESIKSIPTWLVHGSRVGSIESALEISRTIE
ncbi:hypothetical protein [Eubacterium barkeri]|uniref:Uncharacterized protein n=1 Tax=Eubacterium barkeri TaxID=1528 RepID=A0A1H3BHX2_EUBBA|nr:hypothetical protein [Eubacterium barkeri]SDX41308.1 hypothetical protein SAMN04488579_10280 [Eubacterium barkeri]